MRSRYAIGIDVGGTKIEGVLMDDQGAVRKRRRIPTNAEEGPDAVLERIGWLARSLSKRKHLDVGISFPGHLDKEGLLRSCPNLHGLEGKPLRQLLHRHVKHRLIIENDANCFALAEQRMGAGEGRKHVIGLIIGTGIGVGIVANGKLLTGHNGGAGELGHLPYKDCDIESYAAGPGILRRYYKHGGVKEQADRIFEKKTLIGKKTVRETVDALAWLCLVIEKAYDPELIVLGGGVSNAPIIKDLGVAAKELGVTCRIARNTLGDAAGALGAAFLARGTR